MSHLGNYAWINWVGALPYLSLLDDAFLAAYFLPARLGLAARRHCSPPEEPGDEDSKDSEGEEDTLDDDGTSELVKAIGQELSENDLAAAMVEMRGAEGAAQMELSGKKVDFEVLLRAVDQPSPGLIYLCGFANGKDVEIDFESFYEWCLNGLWPEWPEWTLDRPKKKAKQTKMQATGGGISELVAAAGRRLCELVRGVAICGLCCMVVVKSAGPVKELFKPSPWLAFYDEYFLVNSQVHPPTHMHTHTCSYPRRPPASHTTALHSTIHANPLIGHVVSGSFRLHQLRAGQPGPRVYARPCRRHQI